MRCTIIYGKIDVRSPNSTTVVSVVGQHRQHVKELELGISAFSRRNSTHLSFTVGANAGKGYNYESDRIRHTAHYPVVKRGGDGRKRWSLWSHGQGL